MLDENRNDSELQSLCEPKEQISILVVCNSRHHSKNQIGLAEKLTNLDRRIKVVALCEPGDMAFYSKIVDKDKTELLSIDYAKELEKKNLLKKEKGNLNTLTKSKLHSKLSEKFFTVAMRFNNYLSRKSRMSNLFLNIIRETTLVCYLREKRVKAFFLGRKFLVERLLDNVKPTVVFCFGDRHIDIEAPTLMAARSRGIKIIIPYGTYSGKSGLLKIRQIQGEPKCWRPVSLYRLYAGMRLTSQVHQGYFYQHPSVLFALKALGGLSKNPWCIGNGLSDVVCVDNEHTSARYQGEGVPYEKLRVVGDIAYDTLFEKYTCSSQLRKEIVEDYVLDTDKKILVFALPPFAEQGFMGWENHWTEIRYLLDQVSRTNFNIIISLHPRVNADDYSFLEKEFPVRIAKRPLKELLPIANVFAAAGSSTVFWAVLCGIPVVVINFYGLDSKLFDHLKTIKFVNDRTNLLSALVDAASGKEIMFAEDWKNLSRTTVFDGRVTWRYYNIVMEAAAIHSP